MKRSPSVFKVAGLQGRSFTLRYDHHAKLGRSSIDYTLESLSWPARGRLLPIELFTDLPRLSPWSAGPSDLSTGPRAITRTHRSLGCCTRLRRSRAGRGYD